MKIKQDLELSTMDFYGDLLSGGYLDPFDICVDKKDAEKVNKAINIIADFQASIEASYPEFYS